MPPFERWSRVLIAETLLCHNYSVEQEVMASFGCSEWDQEMFDAEHLRGVEAPVTAHVPAKVGDQPERMGKKSVPIGIGGWYDSSWELRRGLIVREGVPADARLDEWLGIELIGVAEELEFA